LFNVKYDYLKKLLPYMPPIELADTYANYLDSFSPEQKFVHPHVKAYWDSFATSHPVTKSSEWKENAKLLLNRKTESKKPVTSSNPSSVSDMNTDP
jgi:hypothetical protein